MQVSIYSVREAIMLNMYNIIYDLRKQSMPDNSHVDWGLKEKIEFLLLGNIT